MDEDKRLDIFSLESSGYSIELIDTSEVSDPPVELGYYVSKNDSIVACAHFFYHPSENSSWSISTPAGGIVLGARIEQIFRNRLLSCLNSIEGFVSVEDDECQNWSVSGDPAAIDIITSTIEALYGLEPEISRLVEASL